MLNRQPISQKGIIALCTIFLEVLNGGDVDRNVFFVFVFDPFQAFAQGVRELLCPGDNHKVFWQVNQFMIGNLFGTDDNAAIMCDQEFTIRQKELSVQIGFGRGNRWPDIPLLQFGSETKHFTICLLYTSPSPRDRSLPRMPSSA